MLSSIHPLGERTRNNRWGVTVAAFSVGAIVAGASVGAVLGWLGGFAVGGLGQTATLSAAAVVVLAAGTLDIAGVNVPGPKRQVNEHWIGTYRGWVYGGAFGIQLGAGLATFVVTWGVYATLALQFISASALAGAVIGVVFGTGRSVSLLLAGRVDRGSRLTSFHKRMASLGPPVRHVAGYGALVVGVVSLAGVML